MTAAGLISIARIVATAYVGLFLVVFFRQSSYVYYPDKLVGLTPAYFNMAYEELALTTQDGETISAWFVPAPTGTVVTSTREDNGQDPARTVLFCHGNAGDMGDRLDSIKTFHDMGMHVLIFDYHGYGDSSGKPTEQNTYLDARAAWDHLTLARHIPADNIVVFGRSLGGSIAAWLAGQVTPGALVIESAFASAPRMAQKMFPFLPARLVCRFNYDSVAAIEKVKCPVLVAHSSNDEMIPFAHGQLLFDAANDPRTFVEMTGGHNSGGLDADPAYRETLKKMLRSLPSPT